MKNAKMTSRLLALMLAVVCMVQIAPVAEARASDYIGSYEAYMTADGSNKVTVWFSITGVGIMDEIGAVTIVIYNSSTGKAVTSYQYTETSGMLGTNKNYHSGSVTYTGTKDTSYYAMVCLYAGRGGKGDSRNPKTDPVTAK